MGYAATQTYEIWAGDDICWEVEAEVDFRLVGGCAPWKGSVYSCPSDVDWYGDAGDLEIDEVRVVRVVEVDEEGGTTDVELDSWEEDVVVRYAYDNLDDDELYEAAADQAEADYEPPEPDFGPDYEYDY